jgi:hypothetical protein
LDEVENVIMENSSNDVAGVFLIQSSLEISSDFSIYNGKCLFEGGKWFSVSIVMIVVTFKEWREHLSKRVKIF